MMLLGGKSRLVDLLDGLTLVVEGGAIDLGVAALARVDVTVVDMLDAVVASDESAAWTWTPAPREQAAIAPAASTPTRPSRTQPSALVARWANATTRRYRPT